MNDLKPALEFISYVFMALTGVITFLSVIAFTVWLAGNAPWVLALVIPAMGTISFGFWWKFLRGEKDE